MPRLSLSLLGGFQVRLGDQPVTGFESNKVRALLAYLVLEYDRPHHREVLAGNLWPNQTDEAARANLRQALANLRKAIHDPGEQPPYLQINRETIRFNPHSDHWCDVGELIQLVESCDRHLHRGLAFCKACLEKLERAAELYRGELLPHFSVGESIFFEEWVLLKRERLHQLAVNAFHQLAECHERWENLKGAFHYAIRQIELDPWREEAHRQVMRLQARRGQRSAALAQYHACCKTLADELGLNQLKKPKNFMKKSWRAKRGSPRRELLKNSRYIPPPSSAGRLNWRN
jgi:DNA-binding SARP family transcriptional activator